MKETQMTATLAPPAHARIPLAGTAAVTAEIPIRYFRDRVAGVWGFAIENPSILGGGYSSREWAENGAVEAVARCLGHGIAPGAGEAVGYLHVEVSPERAAAAA
jgi:hypothetical protein